MLFAQVPASDFASDMVDGHFFPRGCLRRSPGEVRWLLSEDGEHGALQPNKTGLRTGSAWARRGDLPARPAILCPLPPVHRPSRELRPVLYIRFSPWTAAVGQMAPGPRPSIPVEADRATAVAPPRAATWDISLQIVPLVMS